MLPETAPDDGILRNLLNDRLFYLAINLARPDGYRNSFTRLLWQIFGTTSPATLVALFQTALLHGHHGSEPDSAVTAYLNSMGLEEPNSLKAFLSNIEACLSKPGLALTFKPTLWLLKHRLLEVEAEFHEFGFGTSFFYFKYSCFERLRGLMVIQMTGGDRSSFMPPWGSPMNGL
jgi:hypothetical protein